MYVCMYVRMHVCKCACLYGCMCVYIYICIYTHTYIYYVFGRPRRRWEDNIKVDLREVEGVESGWSWLWMGKDGGHL